MNALLREVQVRISCLATLRSRLAPAPQPCPGEQHRGPQSGTLRL